MVPPVVVAMSKTRLGELVPIPTRPDESMRIRSELLTSKVIASDEWLYAIEPVLLSAVSPKITKPSPEVLLIILIPSLLDVFSICSLERGELVPMPTLPDESMRIRSVATVLASPVDPRVLNIRLPIPPPPVRSNPIDAPYPIRRPTTLRESNLRPFSNSSAITCKHYMTICEYQMYLHHG